MKKLKGAYKVIFENKSKVQKTIFLVDFFECQEQNFTKV